MTIPIMPLKTRRHKRCGHGSSFDIDQRWRRTAAVSLSTTQLRLSQCEDRTTPSVAPFYAAASGYYANSLLTSSAAIRNELVIIDPAVPDYQNLIHDLQLNSDSFRHIEFLVLTTSRDGLDQVSEALADRNDLDAVHFITHGVAGAIRMGNAWIDHQALQERGEQVAQWSDALAPGTDVLFYGCDLAANAAGQRFLNSFRQITHADVAASTDRTGSAFRGGNWELEYRAGSVETGIAFSPTLQRSYGGTLALFVVTSTNDSGAGTLREAMTLANSTPGTDTISFGFTGSSRQRIQLNSALPTITERVIIDGTSMSGYTGNPLIELDGSGAGSGVHGLIIQAPSTIRGLSIYQFSGHGIFLNSTSANGTIIQANHVGTDSRGDANVGNTLFGIVLNNVANVTIGGTLTSQRNVISANLGGGILLQGSSTNNATIQGNWIGLESDGISPLGNQSHGMVLQTGASNNFIGGTASGAGNVIANNLGDGVRALGSSTAANQFLGNSIYGNSGLGIDLNGNGPTPNDTGDGDSGANALKNFAVLTLVLTNGTQVTISGTYNGIASTNYRLELFASPTNDPTGYGEGARYLGFVNFTTNSSGNATFNVVLTVPVAAGEFVSSITTDLSNLNSSEFSLSMKAVQPQVVVTPTSGLITTESGGTASFTVNLAAKPTATVTIPISVSNPGEGKVSVTTLTFTTANWSTAQTVVITGLDDVVADGDQPYTIVIGKATSTDTNYNGIDGDDVSVINTDNEVAGVKVTPTSGLVTTEAGGTASFSVVLTSQPVGTVTIAVASSNPAEGTVIVSSLTFTAANWNVPQTVIVAGMDDFVDDGNVAYSIIVSPAVSPGTPYDGVDPTDVSVTNDDNDTAGFIVSPTSGLITTENGGLATYRVRLTSQPLAPVTINIASSNPGEGTPSATVLTFTAANWNIDQIVTITGVDDFVDDGNIGYSILVSPATSGDANYNALDANDVSVTNLDDDTASIVVTPMTGLLTTETGGQASFTVRLASQPLAPVTISLVSSNSTEGTVSVAVVTFTAANWNLAQIVTITGIDDFFADGNVAYTVVVGPASSSDGLYQGLDGADVAVVNNDNDAAGILVTPTGVMVTSEAGGSAAFSVRLTSQPTASVVIHLFSTRIGEGVTDYDTLVFSPADWNVPQTIVVTGIDDFLDDGNQTYAVRFQLTTSADPQYHALPTPDVGVINENDDVAGFVIVGGPQLSVDESGTTASTQIVLTSQPIAPVTFVITSTIPGEVHVATTIVTFDPTNWSVPQSVTFRGVADGVEDPDIVVAVLVETASFDPSYDQRGDALTVTNRNVFSEVSDDSLSTAIKTGTGVPGSSAEEDRLEERALTTSTTSTTSTEIMIQGSSQRFALGGSGGGEEEATATHDANPNSTADMAALVPMDRPGFSPTSKQRFRRAVATLPPDMLAAALPSLQLEPMRESLGKMDRDLQDESGFRSATVRITASTAAVASAGYVLWSLRGAAWGATAFASSLPAWSAFDPLVLLARKQRDDELPGDSLTDMIESAQTV